MSWYRHRRPRGRPPHPDILTPAEWRVVEQVREGRSNAEIADRLGVSVNTVRTHVSRILDKVGVPDRHTLAVWPGEPALPGVRERRAVPGLAAVADVLRRSGSVVRWSAAAAAAGSAATVILVAFAGISGADPGGPAAALDPTETPPAIVPTEPGPEPTEESNTEGGEQLIAPGSTDYSFAALPPLRVAIWTGEELSGLHVSEIEAELPGLARATLEGDAQAVAAAIPPGIGTALLRNLEQGDEPTMCGRGLICLWALPLGVEDAAGEYWAVVSGGGTAPPTGGPGDGFTTNFVALYRQDADGTWSDELARATLEDAVGSGIISWYHLVSVPAASFADAAEDVGWVVMYGPPLMASYAENLFTLRLDVATPEVTVEVAHLHRLHAGELADLDGDGLPEVVVNTSDVYVSCAACGIEERSERLFRWVDGDLVEVRLEAPEPLPPSLQEPATRVVALAQSGLWRDASTLAAEVAADVPDAEELQWLARLVERIASARFEHATEESGQTVKLVLAGEYTQVVDRMTDYTPDEAFSVGALVEEANAAVASREALEHTEAALAVAPDRATVHAVRALGLALASPPDFVGAAASMAEAARLAPDVPFYADAAEWLAGQAADSAPAS